MKENHIGVDIVEIVRIREALSRWGDRFLNRIYTDSEKGLYGDKLESLAARFAGKEAAMKALWSAKGAPTWKEVEILSQPDGKPVVHLRGSALESARAFGLCGLEISFSHSREYAVAIVMGIKE
jgi:holo-[acyl-carrier protein] synthase